MTTHFNPEDGRITASETLVSNHHTTLCSNPENREFYNINWLLDILMWDQHRKCNRR